MKTLTKKQREDHVMKGEFSISKNYITSGAWYRCWLMQDGKQVEKDGKTKANHVKVRKGISQK